MGHAFVGRAATLLVLVLAPAPLTQARTALSVTTSLAEYRLAEPVLLEIEVVNLSDRPQRYLLSGTGPSAAIRMVRGGQEERVPPLSNVRLGGPAPSPCVTHSGRRAVDAPLRLTPP